MTEFIGVLLQDHPSPIKPVLPAAHNNHPSLAPVSDTLHFLRLQPSTMTFVRSLLLLFPLAVLMPMAHGFIGFAGFTAYPQLQELAKAQTDCKLSIRVDIGKKPKNRREQPVPHLLLDGLELDLQQEKAPSDTELPYANGPHPQISSGARAVKVTQQPYFIGMGGKTTVEMESAGWEMVWRDQARSGTILCGLDVLEEAVKNNGGAKLPAGRMYLSFPVWTMELLAEHQARKADVEERASVYIKEKNDKLAAMQETDNLWKKANLYREAAVASEILELMAVHTFQSIPNMDQVVRIQDGLLMGNKGTIWHKDSIGKKVDLGEALVRAKVDPTMVLRP